MSFMAFFIHFYTMNLVNSNGKLLPQNEPIFTADNRGFKYGDGLFETIKVVNGEISLSAYHYERLFTSLQLLQINCSNLDNAFFTNSILELCRLNHCEALARVRLAVYRHSNNEAAYLLEASALHNEATTWNETGWKLDVYPFARKSCDAFANIKSANYLPYVLAGLYANEKECEEALVLNSHNKIADGSKTNVFIIKNKELYTPALNQGCVNGVMRRLVIEESKKAGFAVRQAEVSVDMIMEADEVFLTNAIQGIRWVSQFREKKYTAAQTKSIHQKIADSVNVF